MIRHDQTRQAPFPSRQSLSSGTDELLPRAFLQPTLLPQQPKVLAVLFLSGSRIYHDARPEYPSDCDAGQQLQVMESLSDWDGAIVVDTKHDIFTLMNHHRSVLMGMLAIEQEGFPEMELRVPAPDSTSWLDFDAVRFAGYDSSGAKRSVKVLSMAYFLQSRTSLNTLSRKDRRVYETARLGPITYKERGSGCKPEPRQASQSSSCNPHCFQRFQSYASCTPCSREWKCALANGNVGTHVPT